jgi:NADP-dependent 3-hydroxy acid dehydrogenase YdfG
VLCARGKEDLEKAAREIRETKGVGGVLPIAADVTKANEVEVLISQTVGRFGRVDILVNNAEESAGACLSTNSQTRSGSKYST